VDRCDRFESLGLVACPLSVEPRPFKRRAAPREEPHGLLAEAAERHGPKVPAPSACVGILLTFPPVPTNKLWLEHTEEAAWQSVEALRENLARVEQRQLRMAPPVEGWRELFDRLDAAKAELGLTGETYAAMLKALLERMAGAEARVRTLEQSTPSPASPPMAVSIDARGFRRGPFERPLPIDDDELEGEAPAAGEARLFREIRARYQRLVRESGRDSAGLLADIENRLGELPDLDAVELADAAADLAALALVLARGRTD
jgi:hypothetical protein